ncbi:MAG TPA: glycoside hydrolase family 2 TIM barrel-domain containing protein [Prolixibacteraceae bacterium]|nr:glycoside hydrolase family 2 TIM barrel-domain containing protein [Prolixibacteraceae bacterium]
MKQAIILSLIISAVLSGQIRAQEPQIISVQQRNITSLNGTWKYILDQYENGYYNYRYEPMDQQAFNPRSAEAIFYDYHPTDKTDRVEYDFDKSEELQVPGSWNYQDDKLFYYEGTIWYRKKFDYTLSSSNRLFLYFGAINYEAHIYLNGKKLGMHVGGFTPFNFEITSMLKEKDNSLVIKVDNKRKREGVPTLNTDWFNYGGITRDVLLIEVSSTFVRDYRIQLTKNSLSKVEGYVNLDGANRKGKVTVEIPELKINQQFTIDSNGHAPISFTLNNAILWSPENPKLYEVKIRFGESVITDKIGFRSIETKGSDLLLNGKPIFLRGISIHEENGSRGDRAWSIEDAQMILSRAKELNCNFVRLAHYPHNENMIRVAEQLGLLVWSEIPVYWTIDWNNESTYKNAENQLKDMITRDMNRANIIVWSVANETPVSDARTRFLTNLINKTRELDNTRLVSAALEKHTLSNTPPHFAVEDPFAQYVDILSVNQYMGWYDGLPEKCSRSEWTIKFNKPMIISEFGGGAKYGYHADKDTRWSEEFQEELYIQNIKMLEKIPQLRGMTPWILNDFRSPRRLLPGIQDGWNRKGLFSEKGEKKKAFYILQEYYSKKQ